MIALTNILSRLELVLSGVVTTHQISYSVTYTNNADKKNITTIGHTNNTTPVVALLAPTDQSSRDIVAISIYNQDTVASEITVKINGLGTEVILIKATLESGGSLSYSEDGWNIIPSISGGTVVYPSAGIPISTGTAWAASIIDNSTNWNTAYGWGNHALAGYATATSSTAFTNKTGNVSQWTNDSGYLTSINSTQITTALGYTPVTNARTLTINGTTYDLSDNRSWTISGGATLDAITAATTAATINSAANAVDWQWNSISSGIGFKISSTSTAAASNTQTLFNVALSGANANSGQLTKAGVFSNTHTGSTSTNTALELTASGATTNNALNITAGNIQMVSGSFINFLSNTQRIGSLTGFLQYSAGTSQHIMISTSTSPVCVVTSTGSNYLTFAKPSSTTNAIVFNGDYISGAYRGELTYSNVIKTANGQMDFCGNTGQAGGFGNFTPSEILTIKGSTTAALGSVGIGTTSPVASAKLELSSTTMGFLPPRMTTTEINAIVSPAEGLVVYNLTLNVLCFYDGTGWKKFTHSNM